jgi:hypothetical protein
MDWSSLGLAAVASSTSGLNLYATVLTLGLLQRFGWLQLPAQWNPLSYTWVLALAAVLFVIGVGMLALGVPLMIACAVRFRAFFRGETLNEDTPILVPDTGKEPVALSE